MADRPIRYVFSASGQATIISAFRSIDAAAKQHAQILARSGQAAIRGAKATARVRNETEALAQRVERDQAARGKREARQLERIEKDKTREIERQGKLREKYIDIMQRERRERAIAAHDDRAAVARERTAGARGRLGTAARAVGWMGAAALGAAAGVAYKATSGAANLQELALRHSISGRLQGQTIDPTALRKSWENAAIATPGVKAEDVAAGYARYVSFTGDKETAQAMQGTWATAASATGAGIEELAAVSADLAEKFKITKVEDMQQAFAQLTFQGKQGAFELRDMAAQLPEIAAAASTFGVGTGLGAVKKLGGILQMARPYAGSAAETSTAVQRMFQKLTQESATLKKEGVDVFDKSGKARDIVELLPEIVAKVGGKDMVAKGQKLQSIFDIQGIKAINPLLSEFGNALAAGKTTGEALQMMKDKLAKAIDTTATWIDMEEDATLAGESVNAKMTNVWERVQAVFGEKVLPIVAELGSKLADWLGSTDFEGLATTVAEVIGALGDLAGSAVSFAQEIGLIKEKRYSPAEQAAKAKERLGALGLTEGEKGRLSPALTLMQAGKSPAQALEASGWYTDIKGDTNLTPQQRANKMAERQRRGEKALGYMAEYEKNAPYATVSIGAAPKTREEFVAAMTPFLGGKEDLDLGGLNKQGRAYLGKKVLETAVTPFSGGGTTGADFAREMWDLIQKDPAKAEQFVGEKADPRMVALLGATGLSQAGRGLPEAGPGGQQGTVQAAAASLAVATSQADIAAAAKQLVSAIEAAAGAVAAVKIGGADVDQTSPAPVG